MNNNLKHFCIAVLPLTLVITVIMPNTKLLSELDEAATAIEKEGREAILERYPSLISIVDNQKQIKEEIDIWLSKTIILTFNRKICKIKPS